MVRLRGRHGLEPSQSCLSTLKTKPLSAGDTFDLYENILTDQSLIV